MARPRPISVATARGKVKTYPSLRAACVALGVSYRMAHKRLRNRKSPSPQEVRAIITANGRQKAITVTMPDGSRKPFPSIRAAARFFNVAYLKAWKAIQRGLSPEQAFGLQPRPKRKSPAAKPVAVRFKGKTHRWSSISEAAQANGQTYAAVKDRLRRGWPLTHALKMEATGRRPHKTAISVLHNGQVREFESISALARAFRLDVDLVLQRLVKLKWTPEEAVEIAPRAAHRGQRFGIIYLVTHKKTGRKYVGQTKEVSAAHRWQKHIEEVGKPSRKGLRPLIKAIQEFGPDAFRCEQIDDAASLAELNEKERHWISKLGTLVPNGFNATRGGQGLESGRSVTLRGRRFRTLTEACRHFGVAPSTVSRWLKKGTPDQAFGLAPRPKRHADSRRQPVAFKCKGRQYKYKSKREAAGAHGVPEKKLYRRLNSGWLIQEALEIVQRPGAVQRKPVRVVLGRKATIYPSQGVAARKHGLSVSTLQQRLARKWPTKRALLEPAGLQGRRRKHRRP